MKKEELINLLENIDIPDVDMQHHGKILRSTLLSSSRFKPTIASKFFSLPLNLINNYKSTLSNMLQKKQLLFGGTILAIVAVVALSFGTFSGANIAHAQAKELIKLSQTQISEISPEMRAKLEITLNTNMADTLAEAYAAADLRIMTEAEYQKNGKMVLQRDNTTFTVTPAISQPNQPNSPVKYLSYTNPTGKKVILGLDKNNTLVMVVRELNNNEKIIPQNSTGNTGENIIITQ